MPKAVTRSPLVGDNRWTLIVKLDDIPLMTRGRGVILQRYKSRGLADAKVFLLADGLSWRLGENRSRPRNQSQPMALSRQRFNAVAAGAGADGEKVSLCRPW
jgi:hypothetical protein